MNLSEGILTLRPLEAKLTHDTEILGAMSPYITIMFNKQKFKTKVHASGGKTPKWSDEFVMEITDHSEEATLRVWDEDLTTSDHVGFCKIKMSSLMINMGVEDWFTILFDNKPAGQVLLKSTFEPKGGDQYQAMQDAL